MVALDYHQPLADLLQPVQQGVGLPEILLVVRLRHAVGRRVGGELPAVQQVAEADDQLGPDALGRPAEDLDGLRVLVRKVHVAEGEHGFAVGLGHHSSPATMAAVRA